MERFSMFESIISERCDAKVRFAISSAVKELREFPVLEKRQVVACLQSCLDPVVREFSQALPADHACANLPWLGRSGVEGLGGWVAICGAENAAEAIQVVLRIRKKTLNVDEYVFDTIESLAGFIYFCACKCLEKNISEKHESRSVMDRGIYCRYCGKKTEVWLYFSGEIDLGCVDSEAINRLSSKYCTDHKVTLDNGRWNSLHARAKKSELVFDRELERLIRQCDHPGVLPPITPNAIADLYVYLSVRRNVYFGESISVLRNIARRWVDSGLTERKKEVLALLSQNFSHVAIADIVGVSQQAVSKLIRKIPRDLFLK